MKDTESILKEKQIQALLSKVSQLEKDIKLSAFEKQELEAKLQDIQERSVSMLEINQHLQVESKKYDKKMKEKSQEIDQVHQKLSALQSDHDALIEKVTDLEKKLDEKDLSINELENKLKELPVKNNKESISDNEDTLLLKLKKLDEEVKSYTLTVTKLEQENVNLKIKLSQFDNSRESIHKFKNQNDLIDESPIEEPHEAYSNTKNKIVLSKNNKSNKISSEEKGQNHELDNKNSLLAQYKDKQIKELQNEISELKDQIDNQNKEFESKFQDFSQKLAKKKESKALLAGENNTLQQKLEDEQNNQKQLSEKTNSLKNKLATAKSNAQQTESLLDDANAQLQEKENIIKALKRDTKFKDAKIKEIDFLFQEKNAESVKFKEELAKTLKLLEESNKKLSFLQANTIVDLKKQITELNTEISILKDMIRSNKSILRVKDTDIAKLKLKVTNLENELVSLNELADRRASNLANNFHPNLSQKVVKTKYLISQSQEDKFKLPKNSHPIPTNKRVKLPNLSKNNLPSIDTAASKKNSSYPKFDPELTNNNNFFAESEIKDEFTPEKSKKNNFNENEGGSPAQTPRSSTPLNQNEENQIPSTRNICTVEEFQEQPKNDNNENNTSFEKSEAEEEPKISDTPPIIDNESSENDKFNETKNNELESNQEEINSDEEEVANIDLVNNYEEEAKAPETPLQEEMIKENIVEVKNDIKTKPRVPLLKDRKAPSQVNKNLTPNDQNQKNIIKKKEVSRLKLTLEKTDDKMEKENEELKKMAAEKEKMKKIQLERRINRHKVTNLFKKSSQNEFEPDNKDDKK